MATYRFESGPFPGYRVLSTGPRTIYYSRVVSFDYQFGVAEHGIAGPSAADRIAYVLPGFTTSDERAWRIAERQESVRWTSAEDLLRRIEVAKGEMLGAYEIVVRELAGQGRLTAAEAQALSTPPIDTVLADLRANRTEPLPAIK